MNKSGVVLIATPHAHFGSGLRAIVRSADPALTVFQTRDFETTAQLLQTTRLALLIIDAALLMGIERHEQAAPCVVLVHSAQQERDARTQQISGVIYTDVTTEALTMQMRDWLGSQ